MILATIFHSTHQRAYCLPRTRVELAVCRNGVDPDLLAEDARQIEHRRRGDGGDGHGRLHDRRRPVAFIGTRGKDCEGTRILQRTDAIMSSVSRTVRGKGMSDLYRKLPCTEYLIAPRNCRRDHPGSCRLGFLQCPMAHTKVQMCSAAKSDWDFYAVGENKHQTGLLSVIATEDGPPFILPRKGNAALSSMSVELHIGKLSTFQRSRACRSRKGGKNYCCCC